MSRISLATDVRTRAGAPDKDARMKNAYIELRGDQSAARKRPSAQGGIVIAPGVPQGGSGLVVFWNDTPYLLTGGTGTTWNGGTGYNIGDHVTIDFTDYWATAPNTGSMPPSVNWSRSFVAPVPSSAPTLWTARTLNASGLWDSIIYGSKFIVSAIFQTSYQYSTDGIIWSTGTNANSIVSCAYGAAIYVATGSGAFGNTYATSSDGINWTNRNLPATFLGGTVSFANNKFFVASTSVGGNTYVTSTDGITWSAILASIADIGSGGVVFGNSVYVSLDYNGFVKPFYYSSDGINWSQATVCPNGSALNQLVFGNGLFMVLYSGSQYATSTDGITWTNRSTPAISITNISFGNGYFCMIKSGNSYISANGIAWTPIAFPLTDINPMPMSYGNGKFVAVKYNTNTGASLQ